MEKWRKRWVKFFPRHTAADTERLTLPSLSPSLLPSLPPSCPAQLEEVLMMADIGAATTEQILDDLRAVAKAEKLEPDDVKSVLRLRLIEALSVKDRNFQLGNDVPAADGKVRGREGGREGGWTRKVT